ncbi:helix-turn-helix domain-containing protein [Methylobacterium sp. W2]|nr:helix-turn-helix domain-containing protein [Methylobacterium sp. W2]
MNWTLPMKSPTSAARAVLLFQTACDEARISVSTMRRLMKAGRGPRMIRLSERRIGIRRADLDDWLKSREAVS